VADVGDAGDVADVSDVGGADDVAAANDVSDVEPDGAVAGGDGAPLRVTDEHMNAALDELLDTRNQLTRILLGAPSRPRGQGPGGRRNPTGAGADAVIPDPGDPTAGWPLRR
jgi:hypothetical protein